MSRPRPLLVAPGLAALIVVASVVCAAPAQAPKAVSKDQREREFAQGTEILRWLLNRAHFTPIGKRDQESVKKDPDQAILIVLGDLNWLDRQFRAPELRIGAPELRDFVKRGGALLVAGDRPGAPELLKDLAGVQISEQRVKCHRNLDACYLGEPDLPIVVSTFEDLPREAANPFRGLHVVTNIPAALRTAKELPPETKTLAYFPRYSEYDAHVPEKNKFNLNILTFAVGGEVGTGRFLILADHSVFINEMMWAKNTQNFEFTQRCLAWLAADGRKRVMLVIDGEIKETFDVPLRKLPPIPPIKILEQMFLHRDELIEETQERLARAEDNGRLDAGILQALAGKDDEGMPRLKRYAWWGVGGCLAGLLFYRLRNHGRHLPESGLPRLGAAVAGQRPAGPLFEQRQREQLAAGNLWESARGLARQRLAPLAGKGGPPDGSQVAGGGWSRRRVARQRLRRLWEIAYGDVPVAIPPERWEFFLSELEAFERDVADGTVKMPAA
jgi:hypothetical protein